jgi:hypothetical protein
VVRGAAISRVPLHHFVRILSSATASVYAGLSWNFFLMLGLSSARVEPRAHPIPLQSQHFKIHDFMASLDLRAGGRPTAMLNFDFEPTRMLRHVKPQFFDET